MENLKNHGADACAQVAHSSQFKGGGCIVRSLRIALATGLFLLGCWGAVSAQMPPWLHQCFDTTGSYGKFQELVRLSNGDLLACGDLPNGQGFITRYDHLMVQLWHRTFQFGSGPTRFFDVEEYSPNEIAAVGSCEGWTPGMPPTGMIIKLDGNGALLTPNPTFPSGVAGQLLAIDKRVGAPGFVVVEDRSIPWFSEAWITALDLSFNTVWSTKCDGYGQYTTLVDVVAVPSQGYFVSGITGSAFQDNRMSFWKLATTGSIAWQAQYVQDSMTDKPNVGYAADWDATTSTLLIGGTVYVDSLRGNDHCLLRINPNTGAVLAAAVDDYGGDDRLLELEVDPNGLIYAAGYISGGFWFGLTASDAAVVIYDGNLQAFSIERWEDATLPDDAWVAEGFVLDLQLQGCYVWNGYRTGALPGRMQYGSCVVGIEDAMVQRSMKLFPNPAGLRQEVTLRWDQALDHEGVLEIYGMNGQLLQSTSLRASVSSVTVPAPTVAGIYLVTLRSDKEMVSRKLIVGDH